VTGEPRPRVMPGHDEIVLTVPPDGCLCHSLEHTRAGRLAEAMVTYGQLGTRWHRDALWQESWGRSYAMCAGCWESTRQVAERFRPGLVVRDDREPAAPSSPAIGQCGVR
jgi:hypothetical protein